MEQSNDHLTKPPPMLLDMRRAYETLPEPNELPGLKLQRQLMKDKPNDFIDRMMTLEKAWLAQETAAIQAKAEREGREKAAPPEPEPEIDEGSERVGRLIQELLGKLRGGAS